MAPLRAVDGKQVNFTDRQTVQFTKTSQVFAFWESHRRIIAEAIPIGQS